MGTVVDQIAIVKGGWRQRHSALRLAVLAAKNCLRTGGRTPRDIDLLVNAGVYRDRNLGEPALAAIIQHDIGANPEDPHLGAHGTFSFDVANGSCGVLTALQIVDGFLRARAIECALIVASDADPGHGMSEDFPFSPFGAALLCSWTNDDRGLGRASWANDSVHHDAVNAAVQMIGRRNVLRVSVTADSDECLADTAAQTAKACLHGCSSTLDEVDAIVTAPAHRRYREALAAELGVRATRITAADTESMHTASLAAAFERARFPDWRWRKNSACRRGRRSDGRCRPLPELTALGVLLRISLYGSGSRCHRGLVIASR